MTFNMVAQLSSCTRNARAVAILLLAATWAWIASTAHAAPVPDIVADLNFDGIVSHADYSAFGDAFNSGDLTADLNFDGQVDSGDFEIYVLHYGDTASSPSTLPFTITPTPIGGNVHWTFAFSNVNGALGGHFSIRIDGPSAPNILSMSEGDLFKDNSSSPVGLPGQETFDWLNVIDVDGGSGVNNRPVGVQFDNAAHEAYASLGTTLGQTFSNASPTVFTIVTAGQDETTVRVLSGLNASSVPYTEYGYSGIDYFFTADQVATFSPPVPEPSAIVLIGLVTFIACAFNRCRRSG